MSKLNMLRHGQCRSFGLQLTKETNCLFLLTFKLTNVVRCSKGHKNLVALIMVRWCMIEQRLKQTSSNR